MDQSENYVSKTEAEIKLCDTEVNKVETVKSSALVEEVNKAAETLIEDVKSSSSVTQLEKEVEKLVADPWASLKSLGTVQPESSFGSTKDVVLTTSDKNVGESSETANSVSDKTVSDTEKPENADMDDKPRATHTQPFVAVSAGGNSSWMNCCGLIDVLRRSDQ